MTTNTNTKAALLQKHDELKAKNTRIWVLAFDGRNQYRISTYGANTLLQAFNEMSANLNQGHLVILTDDKGNTACTLAEFSLRGRISYQDAREYSVKF